jgi:peptidoglycan/LPS O-acetylase OafA/YrhL
VSGTKQSAALPRRLFRTDVEGLRAVAVLLVVADHLMTTPSGGFIGVDVFFVISGFLISGLLLKEGERSGRISIRAFYARRVRRIIPAAVVVLVATDIAGRFVFTVSRAHETVVDSLWAAVFMANVHFADVGTDYFAQGAPPSALQHYWSLSVEEQFYVVWPMTLLVVFLLGRRVLQLPTRGLIGGIAGITFVVSFAWCVHQTSTAPTDAYFSTAARAWELSLGALLAVSAQQLLRLPAVARAAAAWLGLAGIGVAAVVINAETAFPGYAAALPVLSTGLVLAAGNPAWGPGRTFVLANPVVQYVGGLSYSLYLWHFPFIVLSAAYWGPTGFAYYLCAAGGAALLSVLSLHLVENPIRHSRWLSAKPAGYEPLTVGQWYRDNKRGLDIALVGAAAMAFLIAGFLDVNRRPEADAAPEATAAVPAALKAATLDPEQARVLAALQATAWGELSPSLDSLRKPPEGCTTVDARNVHRCVYGDTGAARTAVVIGDSIAMAWTPAVREALAGRGWRVQMLTMSECPAVDLKTFRNRGTRGTVYAECVAHRAWARAQIRRLQPDLVVAASLVDFANRIVGIDSTNAPANYAAWQQGSERMLRDLKADAKHVVLLSAPPNSGNLQTCVTRRSKPADCVRKVTTQNRRVAAAERAAAAAVGAGYVDPIDWFCYEGRCPAVIGTTPVMREGTHITAAFARTLGPLLRPALLSRPGA